MMKNLQQKYYLNLIISRLKLITVMSELNDTVNQNLQQYFLNQIILLTKTYNSNILIKSYRKLKPTIVISEPNHIVN